MIRDGHTAIVFCNEGIGREACRIFTDNEDDLYNLSLSGCYNFSLLENVQCESVGSTYTKGVELALIRATFKKGSSAIQGNITNAKVLKAAQKYPDKYKGLQVRLCGWSQYFNRLKKDEQNMMIMQAESVR